jgi:hypothetical protein
MANNTQISPSTQISSVASSGSSTATVSSNFLSNNDNFYLNLENQGDLQTLNSNSFFYLSLANPINWNQYFPYQLMILQDNSSTRKCSNRVCHCFNTKL